MDAERWRKVDQIFSEALKREPNERGAFLDRECAGDVSLRREIETLIRAHDAAGSFMEAGGATSSGTLAGQTIGPYQIRMLIGAGGMGEVYKGWDARLKRDVAIKVLPDVFSRDPDRVIRFQREAEVLASLNHSNIAGIYDVQKTANATLLVLELVDGETLAERIARGPIPIDEALTIGKSICEALEAAHEKGVIHRDLKPANVKITPDGKVKVLDFGLAKAFSKDPVRSDPSDSPTMSAAATLPETILGTAAYMAPEQARGKKVDERADIWAFGCVLYEMLTGKPAFPGENVTEIIAGVLKSEPDWAALPAGIPANIGIVLRRCMEKDLHRRFRSPADVKIYLEEPISAPPVVAPAMGTPAPHGGWKQLVVGVSVGVAVCIPAGIAVWKSRPSPALQGVARFTVSMPRNQKLAWGTGGTCSIMALSPDGIFLAYTTSDSNGYHTYLRPIDDVESRLVSGGETSGGSPVFSTDGESLAFEAAGKLKKVARTGGAPITIADALNCWTGATWSSADDIIFPDIIDGSLKRVPASGGTSPEILIGPQTNKGLYQPIMPELLPGGQAMLFSVATSARTLPIPADADQIIVRNMDTGEQHVLIQGGTSPHYASTGHLLFARAGTIMAAPFDLKRLQVTGRQVAVVEGLARNANGISEFGVSRNGTLAYISGAQQGKDTRTLVWVDRKGVVQPLEAPPRAYGQPNVSPDGRQIAVTIESPKNDVWIYDLARGTLTRLTFEGNNNSRPLWSPDGKRILFRSDKVGQGSNLFMKSADGTGPEQQITKLGMNLPTSISPDGKLAFFYRRDPKDRNNSDIWMVPIEGELKPAVVLQTPYNESAAKISPDGKFLAYHSDESGRYEVYVRSFPGPGGKWQISTDGGSAPVWSRNGKELFYRNGDKMMAVDIKPETSFTAGTPHVLFEGKFESRPGGAQTEADYDVSPDGQRFLMIKADAQAETQPQLHVVLNWFEELKQRVPVK